ITAPDLKELGVIDDIIPEIRGGAHRDLASQAELVDQAINEHLSQLEKLDKQVLLEQRWEKYSNIGSFAK
ncbi:acetyl-CoA carboxylase carboxyl transferase subunit alpha, partial [Terribacillus saccharophilus]